MLSYPPGALSRQAAFEYVGGKSIFEALEKAFPDRIRPFYTTGRLKAYRRKDPDDAIDEARAMKNPLSPGS